MKSLRDLNAVSGRLITITDNRTPSISYSSYAIPDNLLTCNNLLLSKYRPEFGFSQIINAGPGYLDFNKSNSTNRDTDAADWITSGYRFSIDVRINFNGFSNPMSTDDLLKISNVVSWAGVKPSFAGRTYQLTGVGSGTMYAEYDDSPVWGNDGGGNPYGYRYSVFGIKNINDWNLIKNPIINLTYALSGYEIYGTLETAYRSDTWSTAFNTTNRPVDGITAPADVPEVSNANLVNFSRNRKVFAFRAGDSGEYISPNYVPAINESGSDTYSANISVTSGNLKFNAVTYGTSYSSTGNVTTINNVLRNIQYLPDSGAVGVIPLTIAVTKNNAAMITSTVDLTVADYNDLPGNLYIFTSGATFTPTATEAGRYCDIIAIGGGGGAARKSTGSSNGGGAGEVKAVTITQLPAATYTITIGAGGNRATANNTGGSNGGSTYITSNIAGNILVAAGGRGGSTTHGGNYGVGTEISGNLTGGTWWHHGGVGNTYGAGGGGAGGSGTDGNAFSAGGPGAGIDYDDFYLLSKEPDGTYYARGGSGTGGGTTSGYGNGGNGATPAQTNTAGTSGLVMIRIY